MSPRKAAADLVLGGPRVRRVEPPDASGLLKWHHTELGRRTADGAYRIVRQHGGWQVLDAEWAPLADPSPTIPEAQQLAERMAARAARLPRGTSDSVGPVGVSDPVVP